MNPKAIILIVHFFVVLISSLTYNELCNDDEKRKVHVSSCAVKMRILVILPNELMPTQMGSDKRAFHVLQSILAFGYDVHVIVLSTSSSIANQNDELMVNQLRIKYHKSPLLLRNITTTYSSLLSNIQPDIVMMWLWFWTFYATAPGLLLGLTRTLSPKSYVVVLTDDIHSKRELQLAQAQKTTEQQQRIQARALKMKKMELQIYQDSDAVITISEADRRDLLTMDDVLSLPLQEKVFVMRYVLSSDEISPGWVDSSVRRYGLRFAARTGLVFVGNGANPTNALALRWYVSEVAPLLQRALPGVKLQCVGGHWDAFKAAWPLSVDAVSFGGYQSEQSMREVLDSSRVFLSPIVASTGINTKNVLALARGIPLVTMPAGSKGICQQCDAILVRNPFDIFASDTSSDTVKPTIPMLVARSAEDLVDKVRSLYTSETLWQHYSTLGPEHARSWFSEYTSTTDIEAMLTKLLSRPPQLGLNRKGYMTDDGTTGGLGKRGRRRGARRSKRITWKADGD